MAASKRVNIIVNGPAGPRCTVEAGRWWTIYQVHSAIAQKIDVPVEWQTLVKDKEKLPYEEAVGFLLPDDLDTLQPTLVVVEEPGALPKACTPWRTEAVALQLLRQPQLASLNDVNESGLTALHSAIGHHLPAVAMAIIARPDFTKINARTSTGLGRTALHLAARDGQLQICQAILDRQDFTELLAVADDEWSTVPRTACQRGHREVSEFLEAAEAHRRRLTSPTADESWRVA